MLNQPLAHVDVFNLLCVTAHTRAFTNTHTHTHTHTHTSEQWDWRSFEKEKGFQGCFEKNWRRIIDGQRRGVGATWLVLGTRKIADWTLCEGMVFWTLCCLQNNGAVLITHRFYGWNNLLWILFNTKKNLHGQAGNYRFEKLYQFFSSNVQK